jgi:hypothetical protein
LLCFVGRTFITRLENKPYLVIYHEEIALNMISMRTSQKLMRAATIRGMTNQGHNYCRSSLRTIASVQNISTDLANPSNNNAKLLKHEQFPSSRSMSTATTSMVAEVNLSLDQLSSSIAGGDYVSLLVKDNPYLDVVQYTHKNVIYNVSHINYHSEALAIGITENGLIPGDVVLTFLPPHLCETVRLIARSFVCVLFTLIFQHGMYD